jgi:hypothetical protein
LCDVKGPLVSIVPFTKLFYGAHSSLYYQHGRYVKGVIIIESSSSTRQGDPLKRPLFVLAHDQTFLMTIMHAPSYVFPSLANDTHIVGPMGEIICAFGHLSTQLSLVGFKVKMSMCKLWNPSRIFPGIRIHQHYIFVTDGLCILGVPMGSQDFATHFLDGALSQDVAYINDLLLLGRHPCCFGHFILMCNSSTFLSHINNTSFFLFLLVGFNKKVMQVCGDIMGLRSWESFQGPLAKCQVRLLVSFGGISLFSMEVYAPFFFGGIGF